MGEWETAEEFRYIVPKSKLSAWQQVGREMGFSVEVLAQEGEIAISLRPRLDMMELLEKENFTKKFKHKDHM